jgi:hypothetical protein
MDRITHHSPRQQGYGSTSSLRNDSLKHTRKHERKEGGTEPTNEAARRWRTVPPGGADCPDRPPDSPAKRRGQSAKVLRTLRKGAADSPARNRGQSVKANRATRNEPRKTDRPRRPGGLSARAPDQPLVKLGLSANRLQRKPKT